MTEQQPPQVEDTQELTEAEVAEAGTVLGEEPGEVTEAELDDGQETEANTMNEPDPETLPAEGEQDPDLPVGGDEKFDGAQIDDDEPTGVAQPDDPFAPIPGDH